MTNENEPEHTDPAVAAEVHDSLETLLAAIQASEWAYAIAQEEDTPQAWEASREADRAAGRAARMWAALRDIA
jgi:hypothetical protein